MSGQHPHDDSASSTQQAEETEHNGMILAQYIAKTLLIGVLTRAADNVSHHFAIKVQTTGLNGQLLETFVETKTEEGVAVIKILGNEPAASHLASLCEQYFRSTAEVSRCDTRFGDAYVVRITPPSPQVLRSLLWGG